LSEAPRPTGVVGAIAGLGSELVRALPGHFVALLALNVAFLLGLLWFVHAESALRVRIVDKVLDVCSAEIEQAGARSR
jgi:hypothetical protein